MNVAVIGAGTMGSGIAQTCALAGHDVVLLDTSHEALQRADAAIRSSLARMVKKESIGEDAAVETVTRVEFRHGISGLESAGVVIEAVFESLEVKREVWGQLAAVTSDGALLATNTSSLSVTAIAEFSGRPERFCGMHFFNPVPPSKLVEIVAGKQTSDELIAAAQGWVASIGKTPITVHDVPGFASSRLGVALGLEAIRMLEDGVASADDIDAAMALGYGHPMGPLRLTDVIGLDVRLGISEYLHVMLGDRFEPPKLLRDMVERGELGRKSGKGFYEWPQEHS